MRFIALPYCFFYLMNWKECSVSRFQVIKDFLYIFFRLKSFPDFYSPYRLWEKDRKEWAYYYGSGYDAWHRYKLRKEIWPLKYLLLFDDKYISDLLCRGIGNISLPKFYGVIRPDDVGYQLTIQSAVSAANIIIKPIEGSAGRGIALAYTEDGHIYIKQGETTIKLEEFKLDATCIIQELLTQNEQLSKIAPNSVNTVRVVTLLTGNNESIIISASMRFGVGSAYVDNWSAGGVAVGVDVESGILKKVAFDKYGNEYLSHPVSKTVFEGCDVPEWNKVAKLAIKVQKAFPYNKMLGHDIAITENGPVLIEINPSTDLVFQEQTAGPLLKNKHVYKEFERYGLLVNSPQRKLHSN